MKLNKQQEIELEHFIHAQLVSLVRIIHNYQQFPVFCVSSTNLIYVSSEGERI